MRRTILISALLAAGLVSGAQGKASLGKASYGGTGCPAGTASAVLSGSTLNIRYSAYRVAAGGATGKSFDRKACNLAIPVDVPRGKSVAIISAKYRAITRLPAGARAQFRAEYFFAGSIGPVATRVINGPARGLVTLSTPGRSLVWSTCGKDVILRTNSSLRVSTTRGRAAAVSIRAQEVKAAVVYRLRWRNC